MIRFSNIGRIAFAGAALTTNAIAFSPPVRFSEALELSRGAASEMDEARRVSERERANQSRLTLATNNAIRFSPAVPFTEALESRDVRSILPTTLTSAEIREVSGDILERATFSARVANAEYLQEIDDVTRALLNGEIDEATARTQLKVKLRQLGYEAAPGEAGTIKDFMSDRRTDLVVKTNAQIAQGFGQFKQGQDPDVLDSFPAQELFRLVGKKNQRTWGSRWSKVGGRFYEGRMIARKDSPVWLKLGTAFDDSLGNPYPPFAFNSGMWVKDVSRSEAERLGIIKPEEQVAPQERALNDDLKYSPKVRGAALREALESHGYEFDGDVLMLGGNQ